MHGAQPPVLVVVGGAFFLALVVVVAFVVVRLIAGSKVLVEISRHDPNRGKITQKL